MKYLLNILVFVLLSYLGAQGQIYIKPNNSYGLTYNRVRPDSTLWGPTGCGVPVGTASLRSSNQFMSAFYYDSCGHKLYVFDPSDSSWAPAGGGVTGLANQGDGFRVLVPPDSFRTIRPEGTWFFMDTVGTPGVIRAGVDPQYAWGLLADGSDRLYVDSAAGKVATKTDLLNKWSITGNSGTDSATNFIGTTDTNGLVFRTNNIQRALISSTGDLLIGKYLPFDNNNIFDLNVGDGHVYMSFSDTANEPNIFGELSTIGKGIIIEHRMVTPLTEPSILIGKAGGSITMSVKAGDSLIFNPLGSDLVYANQSYLSMRNRRDHAGRTVYADLSGSNVNQAYVDAASAQLSNINFGVDDSGTSVRLRGWYASHTSYLINQSIGIDTIDNYIAYLSLGFLPGSHKRIGKYFILHDGATAGIAGKADSAWGLYLYQSQLRNYIQGNLGLGVRVPNAKLHVVGTGLFTDTLTATTMGNSDSSNRVATTAWVKRQGFGTGGSADSSTFSTNYRRDTAIANVRSELASADINFYNADGRGSPLLMPVSDMEMYLRTPMVRVNGAVADTSASTDSTIIYDITDTNFGNANITATGDRTYDWAGKLLSIDSISTLNMFSRGLVNGRRTMTGLGVNSFPGIGDDFGLYHYRGKFNSGQVSDSLVNSVYSLSGTTYLSAQIPNQTGRAWMTYQSANLEVDSGNIKNSRLSVTPHYIQLNALDSVLINGVQAAATADSALGIVYSHGNPIGNPRTYRMVKFPVPSGGGSGMAIGSAVTSGTSESVLYVDASSNLAQDNANFHYTPGTTTLFVPTLRSPTATDLTLRAATSQKVSIVTGGVERLAVNSGGAIVLNDASNSLTIPSTRGTTGQALYATDGSGNLGWTDVVTPTGTQILTNKRLTARVTTTASSSTPTPDADASDMYTVTALAANATFGAPTGTPTDGQALLIRIKDDGTARTLSWNAIYRAGTDFALPTTTVISKTIYLQVVYNAADSKWDATGLTEGF